MVKREVRYEKLGVTLRGKDEPLTVDEAKAYLGWESESEAEQAAEAETAEDSNGDGKKKRKQKSLKFGSDYTLRDSDGNKVRLMNNLANRPLRRTLALRYANEILRHKWKLNGETIVIDRFGVVADGQHRLVGVVLAEQVRKQNPEYWKKMYGWRGPITVECLIVTGIDDKPDVRNTINLGLKRQLSDVLFQDAIFNGTEQEQKKLSSVLAAATRLVWLRAGGMVVTDAPHFPHSEALDFLDQHPRLKDAAYFVEVEDGGGGVEGRKISSYLSLGYAAALLYLMGMSATDPSGYQETGELDDSLWEKAEEFWTLFAQGDQSLNALRKALVNISGSGGMGRDEIVGTVIKAYNLWAEGQEVTGKDIKVKRTTDRESGKVKLSETPRLGGLDTEPEVFEDEPADQDGGTDNGETTELDPQPKAKRSRKAGKSGKASAKSSTNGSGKGKRSRKKTKAADEPEQAGDDGESDGNGSTYEWEEGMEVIVDDGEGEWSGTITELPGDGTVRVEAEGAIYEARVEHLRIAETAAA